MDISTIPEEWRKLLADQFNQPYFQQLRAFLEKERRDHQVFPPEADVFAALRATPRRRVKAVLLGQDPYHDEGQAEGLAFSVPESVPPPPSLRNILRELHDDLGCPVPDTGSLAGWAGQGVLLLNTVLTVRAHQANSHRGKGWEKFTDEIIRRISAGKRPAVFILWGAQARAKKELIDTERHTVIEAAHPSPLSARRGFFGSRPFSETNKALRREGIGEIDWCRTDS